MDKINYKEVASALAEWRKNPVGFFRFMWPKEKVWDKQIEICESLLSNNRTYVKSGHSTSKTHTCGKVVIWWQTCFPPAITITTAPTYRQVESQLWGEIRKSYNTAKWPLPGKLLPTAPMWHVGDKYYAQGLSTKEPDKIQGSHGDNVLVVIDEGSGVPDKIYDAIDSLMSGGNCKLLVIGNPLNPVGAFWRAFQTSTKGRITISCLDAVKQGIPGLVTQDWIDEQKRKYDEGINPLYPARVLGEFPTVTLDTVFSVEDIDKMFGGAVMTLNIPTPIYVTCSDPAFGGLDEAVIGQWKNYQQIDRKITSKREAMETTGDIIAMSVKHQSQIIALDVCGGGKVIESRIKEQGLADKLYPINSASRSGDKDKFDDSTYYNLRAAMWFNAKDLARQGVVRLLTDDITREQLLSVKYHRHSSGKIIIDSKEDIKSDYGSSPDRAEEVVYALWTVRKYMDAHPTNEMGIKAVDWLGDWDTQQVTQDNLLGVRE